MARSALCIAVAAAVTVLTAGAAAADGGPAPGATFGGNGVSAAIGHLRYVALLGRSATMLAVVRPVDGRVVRYRSYAGAFGIPTVAWDGTTDGISGDGRRLVLTSALGGRPATTRFLVVSLPALRPQRTIVLRGLWVFDAISPDGATVYALQYASDDSYAVRAIDTSTGRMLPGAIVDRREPDEAMLGSPVTRTWSGGHAWAYTLYAKPNGTAFVHALDTANRTAVCLDLPWRGVNSAIWGVRLHVRDGGRMLGLAQRGRGLLATIDLRTRSVHVVQPPRGT